MRSIKFLLIPSLISIFMLTVASAYATTTVMMTIRVDHDWTRTIHGYTFGLVGINTTRDGDTNSSSDMTVLLYGAKSSLASAYFGSVHSKTIRSPFSVVVSVASLALLLLAFIGCLSVRKLRQCVRTNSSKAPE